MYIVSKSADPEVRCLAQNLALLSSNSDILDKLFDSPVTCLPVLKMEKAYLAHKNIAIPVQ